MVKDNETVIEEFSGLVNMSAKELEDWLKTETPPVQGGRKMTDRAKPLIEIGHDSGNKVVAILKKNPKKDLESYGQDDIAHMRKVVAYCKRHLAQEETAKKNTDSKSYKSLKNWGHDAQKA